LDRQAVIWSDALLRRTILNARLSTLNFDSLKDRYRGALDFRLYRVKDRIVSAEDGQQEILNVSYPERVLS